MDTPREPHPISLKVLRLSKPTLSQNFPLSLPADKSSLSINPKAALDLREREGDDQFLLNPTLSLPPAFGSAYVGETFSCTLCVNNELTTEAERQVSSVKIEAEMQTPSGTTLLEVVSAVEEAPNESTKPGDSIQRIVRFDLREEGSHTLAVNIIYSETTIAKSQPASSGRVRSFRKLYQFVARSCLNVRTKVTPLTNAEATEILPQVVEVQLDNMADGTIILQKVTFNSKPAFLSTSLNWDLARSDDKQADCPTMAPRDVLQIAFLLEQRADGPSRELTKDGRAILGTLGIQWRTTMGGSGFLSTGWLTTKRR